AGAGADDEPDREPDGRAAGAARRRGGARGRASLHADAGGGEAELRRGDERDARRLPRARDHTRGVHEPDRAAVSPARLAARCLELLGPVTGPVVVAAPRAFALRAALASRLPPGDGDGTPAAAVVAFLGAPGRVEERQRLLRDLQRRLPE